MEKDTHEVQMQALKAIVVGGTGAIGKVLKRMSREVMCSDSQRLGISKRAQRE